MEEKCNEVERRGPTGAVSRITYSLQFVELSSVYDYLFACTSHVVTVSANFFSQQEAYTRESPFCYLSWRKYYSSASTIERVKGPFNVH